MVIHGLDQHVGLLLKTIEEEEEEKQHTSIVASFNLINENLHNYCRSMDIICTCVVLIIVGSVLIVCVIIQYYSIWNIMHTVVHDDEADHRSIPQQLVITISCCRVQVYQWSPIKLPSRESKRRSLALFLIDDCMCMII